MSIEDYQKFARMLKDELADCKYKFNPESTIVDVIRSVACVFTEDNPRFDRKKFYLASGLNENGRLL